MPPWKAELMRKRDAQRATADPSVHAAAPKRRTQPAPAPAPAVVLNPDEEVLGFGGMEHEFSSTDNDTLSEDNGSSDSDVEIASMTSAEEAAPAAPAAAPAVKRDIAQWLMVPEKAVEMLVMMMPKVLVYGSATGGDGKGAIAHPVVLTLLSNAFGTHLEKGSILAAGENPISTVTCLHRGRALMAVGGATGSVLLLPPFRA